MRISDWSSDVCSSDLIHTYYGAIQALNDVSVEVNKGEIVTLIGANGAGKTTLLMTVCGSPRASSGTVTFLDEDITPKDTHTIMQRGDRKSTRLNSSH